MSVYGRMPAGSDPVLSNHNTMRIVQLKRLNSRSTCRRQPHHLRARVHPGEVIVPTLITRVVQGYVNAGDWISSGYLSTLVRVAEPAAQPEIGLSICAAGSGWSYVLNFERSQDEMLWGTAIPTALSGILVDTLAERRGDEPPRHPFVSS